MKNNELMIGDLVILNYEGVIKYVKILRLHQHYCDVMTINGTEINSVAYSLIHELPVSENILTNIGFRNEDDIWLSKDDSYGIDNQKGLMEFFKYIFFEDDSELEVQIPRCYDVHKLQHALRISGLGTIADNIQLPAEKSN